MGFGIDIVPSSFKLFSKNDINILGDATTVLLRVCGNFRSFSLSTLDINTTHPT